MVRQNPVGIQALKSLLESGIPLDDDVQRPRLRRASIVQNNKSLTIGGDVVSEDVAYGWASAEIRLEEGHRSCWLSDGFSQCQLQSTPVVRQNRLQSLPYCLDIGRNAARRCLGLNGELRSGAYLFQKFYPVSTQLRGRKRQNRETGVSRCSEMVTVDAIVVYFQSTPNFPSWHPGLSARENQ